MLCSAVPGLVAARYRRLMALRPDEFYEHALAAADGERRPLYGSWMVVWDDLLPEYPAEVADTDAAMVADALVASCGGRRLAAAGEPPA
jgi:hypothetical protein